MRRVFITMSLVAVLMLGGGWIAWAETVNTTVKGTPKVFQYITDNASQTRVICMWQKKGTDIDIIMHGDTEDGIQIGVGFSVVQQLEMVEIGAPAAGAATFFTLFKVSGRNTKTFCNANTMGDEGVTAAAGRRGRNLRYVGNLDELALLDPFFAKIQEDVKAAKRFKRRAR